MSINKEWNKALNYNKIKFETSYEKGKMQIGTMSKILRVSKLTKQQADILNSQFDNSGIKYELVEEKKKRTKKEEENA